MQPTNNHKNAIIELQGLSKVFATDKVQTHALNHIGLRIYPGEFVAITGPSGCGKSTLLSLLGLLDAPSSGQYRLAGHDASSIDTDERARIRNKEIGFVFQSFNLISNLTVAENIELPLTYRGNLSKAERHSMTLSALAQVDMAHRQQHYPAQLSGGQQQRVAVARAIAGNPAIILADEPTGNLDSKNAEAVMALLEQLNRGGTTICMVTHDSASAARTKRIVEVFDGQIVADR
ncbi:ABC transporter ATP-binding protein [Bowmanella denitrificans]|uniref:ABC transporter ATP-binding protein n=1 Tax=Bowmanella denitrificans TaxID=366582 RepID=UPI000C9B0945|nr:ABC transporter ATP-binding protein [Bowmanella denitrificans]